ncbi:amino acid ABC transporter permease [Catellatospora tritici]|uniref:amino acid ABC transporter permease n=1 Tax=Catellatospora tritici TaxID=2851566 RepID=UPI001C2DAC3D|nr:amino acid ABC transporter permease [Catellatospora tritici]MBV1848541.1 amino acid ABC transporter permease [Catellatospora tritici]MBV1851439.1 amino acid ABC transporter permease [Catellatospora tritici]
MDVFSDPLNRQAFLDGFAMILKLTAASALLSLALGLLLAACRVSPVPVLRALGAGWVHLFRNTPLTLIITFCFFGLYSAMGVKFSDDINVNNYWLAVVGLSAYTAAFVCEAIRSGINTVPIGQAEAARALGLTFSQNLRLIILPQAVRSVVAPLGSILIALTKNATIAGVIGVLEASSQMKQLINDNGDAAVEIFAVFALAFVVLLVPIGYGFSALANRLVVRR